MIRDDQDWHEVKASSFADPADVAAFKRCKEQGGTDQECFKIGDNGIGKWGTDTTQPIPMCALPPEQWEHLENPKGTKVVVESNNRRVVTELQDTMPHEANITNGAGIDLNPEACKRLGYSPPIMVSARWKFGKPDKKQIAFVVGHNKVSGGYFSPYIGFNEFDFWSKFAEELRETDTYKPVVYFRRYDTSYTKEIQEVYDRINKTSAAATIELHFNAFDEQTVSGCEVLSSGSDLSLDLCHCLQASFVKTLGINDRGVKIAGKNDRGYLSLVSGVAPAAITEPFFGSSPKDCDLISSLGMVRLVEMFSKAIDEYVILC